MPAASVITTYLNPPFNRKIDFHTAFKTAVENAGYPVADVDVFDIDDGRYITSYGSTFFGAGTVGSIRGFVKEITFNASAKGTIQVCFFTRTIFSSSGGGFGSNTNYQDIAFVAGWFAFVGGWNSTTKRPNTTNPGEILGGWVSDNSGANLAMTSHNFVGIGGSSSSLGWPHNNSTDTNIRRRAVLNYIFPIKFTAINHPEIRGVYIQQLEKIPMFIGLIRPANIPQWWNENTKPYAYGSTDSSFLLYRGFSGTASPFLMNFVHTGSLTFPGQLWQNWATYYSNTIETGIGGFDGLNDLATPPVNPGDSNRRQLISSPSILFNNENSLPNTQSSKWLGGQFSNDIVVTNSQGLDFLDKIVISPGVEEYSVISTTEFFNSSNSSFPLSYRAATTSSTFMRFLIALRTT